MRYGVWYDDGSLDVGWLAEEHNHGRRYRLECTTLEDAETVAERQRAYDSETLFVAQPIDGKDEARLLKFREQAKQIKISRLEREITRLKALDGEPPVKGKTSWERIDED